MARSKHNEVCDRSVKATTKMPKEQLKWKLKIRNVEQMAGSKHNKVSDRSVKVTKISNKQLKWKAKIRNGNLRSVKATKMAKSN